MTDVIEDDNSAAINDVNSDAISLRQDVLLTLVECHRDRRLAGFHGAVAPEAINALANALAYRLAPKIGGRYVPKGVWRAGAEERAARDAAVVMAFNGRNRAEVMKQFGISKRLFYSILSRGLKK